ncbi:calcium-binding protein [Nostoc sp. TCL26-01]|uniref:calcium-binding protein n=1 Tax=Nostoc sp. TCL26-01 TaxID=2576904 RepID=UPI0015BC15F0|nr:calcium-binding protein [Nostoc sp. TCL26-01]QLE54535.1 calcium-binding protein [Nostoc sp. TCL26-01]
MVALFHVQVGTLQDDSLTGSDHSDYIFGLGGNDTLNGLGGSDSLFGGDGDDIIDGGDGNDWLFGENGNDTVLGGNGNDYLDGGAGDDTLDGCAGSDRFLGSVGSDRLIGGTGRDIADYRFFGQGITLRFEFDFLPNPSPPVFQAKSALRVIKNGGSGVLPIPVPASGPKDTLESVETIIGAVGKTNTIDFAFKNGGVNRGAFIPAVAAPAIHLDLAAQKLTYDTTTLSVQNFSNAIGSQNNDTLLGDNKANVLDGMTGTNVLNGRGGDDNLKTFENDILTGGSGADQFTLKASGKVISGRTGVSFQRISASTITDFTPGVDTLVIDNAGSIGGIPAGSESTLDYFGFSGYGNFTVADGQLAPERFLVLGSGSITSETLFIYDGTNGDLFYLGAYPGFGSQVKVATLQGAPTLTANDILVV